MLPTATPEPERGSAEPIDSSIEEMLGFSPGGNEDVEAGPEPAVGVPPLAPPAAQPPPAPASGTPPSQQVGAGTHTPPALPPAAGAAPAAIPAPAPSASPVQETPEAAATRIKAFEDQAIAEIAKNVVISPQDLEALQIGEFDKVLPRLVAQTHVGVFRSVYAAVSSQMPVIARQVMAAAQAETAREAAFFKLFPQLNPSHRPIIDRAATLYFQANPQARAEMADPAKEPKILQEMGSMALVLAGLVGQAPPLPPATAQTAPPATSPRPFIPAQPGGGGAPVVPGAGNGHSNPFTAFQAELDELANRADN